MSHESFVMDYVSIRFQKSNLGRRKIDDISCTYIHTLSRVARWYISIPKIGHILESLGMNVVGIGILWPLGTFG
jgi:hypothetical protein